MAKRRVTKIPVTPSSGNVFADMGMPEAEEELTKAQLASPAPPLERPHGVLSATPRDVSTTGHLSNRSETTSSKFSFSSSLNQSSWG